MDKPIGDEAAWVVRKRIRPCLHIYGRRPAGLRVPDGAAASKHPTDRWKPDRGFTIFPRKWSVKRCRIPARAAEGEARSGRLRIRAALLELAAPARLTARVVVGSYSAQRRCANENLLSFGGRDATYQLWCPTPSQRRVTRAARARRRWLSLGGGAALDLSAYAPCCAGLGRCSRY